VSRRPRNWHSSGAGGLLDSGKAETPADIARLEAMNVVQVREILRLTLLAPDIIEAIVDARAPRRLTLEFLLRRSISRDWEEQGGLSKACRLNQPSGLVVCDMCSRFLGPPELGSRERSGPKNGDGSLIKVYANRHHRLAPSLRLVIITSSSVILTAEHLLRPLQERRIGIEK
jgi:hypothetical protein